MDSKSSRQKATPWWQDSNQLSKRDWQPLPAGSLTGKQRGLLKGLAHSLKPVVLIGQDGITPTIIGEIRKQLVVHELIKVKWSGLSKDDGNKKDQARALAGKVGAHFVQLLGQTVLFYRRFDPSIPAPRRDEPIQLPLE